MNKISFNARIIGTIIVVIILCASIASYQVYKSFIEGFSSVIEKSVENRVIDQAEMVKLFFQKSKKSISIVSKNSEVIQFLSGKDELEDEVLRELQLIQSEEYLAVYLMNPEGDTLVSTDPRFVGKNYKFRSYFQSALSGDSKMEVAMGATSKELGLYFAEAVYDLDKSLRGVVVVKINPLALDQVFSHLDETAETVFITDTYGIVIYSNRSEYALHSFSNLNAYSRSEKVEMSRRYPLQDINHLPLDQAWKTISEGDSRTGSIHTDKSYKGKDLFGFAFIPDDSLYVVFGVDSHQQVQKYQRSILITSGMVLLIALIASMIIATITYRFLMVFQSLDQIADDFAHGKNITIPKQLSYLGNISKALHMILQTASHNQMRSEKEVKSVKQELAQRKEELESQQDALLNALEDIQIEKYKALQLASDLEKFKLAVDGTQDLVVITDSEGKIIYTNPVVEKVTGYTPREAIGHTPGSLWGGRMSDDFYQKMWTTIKKQKKTFRGVANNIRRDGREYVADLQINPILGENKEVRFFLAVQRDITKEEEIDQMKTDFISLASHQLRTPLSAMKWFLEMLLDGDAGKLTKEQKDYVVNVHDSNERMISLVNALLNVSRIESGRLIVEPKHVDIAKLIKDCLQEARVLSDEKHQKIAVSIEKNIPKISLDPKLIRNVYMNLLTNAIKYSPDKSPITIKIGVKDGYLISEVTDEGFGIPDGEKNKIFSKFFRASNVLKADTDGNGLGLYLVKKIVESSGGRLWFESKLADKKGKHGGTMFSFTIPLRGMKKHVGEVELNA